MPESRCCGSVPVVKCRECGEPFEPIKSNQRYCCVTHRRRWNSKHRIKDRRVAAARRRKVLGRSCVYCSINDSEVGLWSGAINICAACERLRSRIGTCECGQIFRTTFHVCYNCDSGFLIELGYRRIILIAPNDDRERIIWRKMNRIPVIHVATLEEWRQLR